MKLLHMQLKKVRKHCTVHTDEPLTALRVTFNIIVLNPDHKTRIPIHENEPITHKFSIALSFSFSTLITNKIVIMLQTLELTSESIKTMLGGIDSRSI